MKMNWQGHDRVHLRAGTPVVVVAGRFFFLGKGEASGSEWKGSVHVMQKLKK